MVGEGALKRIRSLAPFFCALQEDLEVDTRQAEVGLISAFRPKPLRLSWRAWMSFLRKLLTLLRGDSEVPFSQSWWSDLHKRRDYE